MDGVPFGRPYSKRSSSLRPAIRIPPRKGRVWRRTTLSGLNASPHNSIESASRANHSKSNAEVVPKRGVKINPPGQGSPKTKRTNRQSRRRVRRKLGFTDVASSNRLLFGSLKAPKFNTNYQNDNTELNYDDQLSPQACREGNEDIAERQSCEMDATLIGDLPLVPEALACVPDLVEDEMRKGAIIAYKQLELSTNWQPKVSDYRVAVVECLLDSGLARVRLEKRYWNHANQMSACPPIPRAWNAWIGWRARGWRLPWGVF